MQIGSYEAPEWRLVPNVISDIKRAYESMKTETMTSNDLGGIWGYKNYSTGAFYRRLNSAVVYGLLQTVGKGSFRVTELGESLAFPENDELEKRMKHQAVMNVPLWREIFQKHGKNVPEDNFWVQLRNITGIDAVEAKKISSQIRKWYLDDVYYVSEELEKKIPQTKSLSSTDTQSNQMSQQMVSPSNTQTISFANKYSISLPKGDLEKEYEKFDKYMKLYIEDYKEEKMKLEQEQKLEKESQLENGEESQDETHT